MNILQLITGIGIGGAEKVVYDLTKMSTQDNNCNMIVVSLDDSDDRLEDFNNANIKVISLNMQKSISEVIKATKKIHSILIKYDIDIVHAHMPHSAILMSIYNSLYKKIPVIFTPHSVNMEGKSREFFLHLFKQNRNHDILFAEEHHQFYNKKNNWSIIANGININQIQQRATKQLKNKTFTFINVARFNEAKNQLFLLDCIKKLKDKGYQFQLLIVGDGEMRNEIESKISQENLGDVVQLLGIRKDIPELLGQAHAFVLPSVWEGLPISVLEAGAAKIPVLTTPVGDLPNLLGENRGVTATEESYINEMEQLITNYSQYKVKAHNLYKYLEQKYSMESVYNTHINLYEKYIK